jgi:hypothetical protein
MKLRTPLFIAAFALGVSGSASATLWDLETIALGAGLTSVSQTVDGITMTITRPGTTFEIRDIDGVPASYGDRTLYPFNDTSAIPFIINFSTAITGISIDYGDFTPSDLDTLSITAYAGLDATGAVVGSGTSAGCCDTGSGFQAHTFALAASGIRSIVVLAGSDPFPMSLFLDNFQTAAVPEPGTLLLLGIGLAGAALARRRMR